MSISVGIVIPVYRGEETLPGLIEEISALTDPQISPSGHPFHVSEVVLVWDSGPGTADEAIRGLAERFPWIRPVWLSRNFGQHAATLAGMTSSTGDWIVTMDEDGQHDPAYIGAMLDVALAERAQLVYASPTNEAPHNGFRNLGSRFAKWTYRRLLGGADVGTFHSYRLIQGEVGRSSAAYTGPGVYLDVALTWVISRVGTCPVPMRSEGRPASNYTMRRLISHFGRLVVSSGTRPLAWVSVIGLVFFLLGLLYSIWVLASLFIGERSPEGWASTFVGILIVGGLILFSLGVIAQYMRVTVDTALGKPLYVVVADPEARLGGND